jgi:hypothetical protein
MLLPTTADHIASIRSTEVAADNTGGAPRLCEKTWLDGGKQDTTFLLVETTSGELKGSFSAAPQLDLATITEIQIIADTGPIGFRRVANVTGGSSCPLQRALERLKHAVLGISRQAWRFSISRTRRRFGLLPRASYQPW